MSINRDLTYYDSLPYRVDLKKDVRDDVWFASCPELPGVKAAGKTQEEALAAARELKTLWLKVAIEKGKRIPEPEPESTYSGKFNLRISKSLHERAVSAARMDGVTLNVYVAQALAEKVERSSQEHFLAGLAKTVRDLPELSGTFHLSLRHLGKPAERVRSEKGEELVTLVNASQ